MERFLYIINIALEAVFLNKSRSILTALGIIFGVAAVIAMLAIGNGAKQEILNQIKLVGVNNIIITPKIEDKKDKSSEEDEKSLKEKFSPGLTIKDAQSIAKIIPTVVRVSPEVNYDTYIIKDGIRKYARLSGVTPDFFKVFNLNLKEGGMFNKRQLEKGNAVCILGPTLKSKFFPHESAIGKYIKCGKIWLKVIGVLENRNVSENATENLGISDYNNYIYAPIQTILLRFQDRSTITSKSISRGGVFYSGNSVTFISDDEEASTNINQLDKIVVQIDDSKNLDATTDIIVRLLKRRHSDVVDFEIKVPELLLAQEQRTKDIFNWVLLIIASISLLVGGIGIMNIMLASVMERIKEIGIRMAAGARRKDIILQFISEATLISISGGILGIVLGIAISYIIAAATDILTIISAVSIFISFGVSVSVGIIFGYMPAKKAAMQDPVTSLRHE